MICEKCNKPMREMGLWPDLNLDLLAYKFHCLSCNHYQQTLTDQKPEWVDLDGNLITEHRS